MDVNLNADRKTLQALLEAFLDVDLYWLRTYDFGGPFRWAEGFGQASARIYQKELVESGRT